MAPLDQYLMDREAEISMARGAAPSSISNNATILVLGSHGYETVAEGTNSFTCLVERSWMSPFDDPQFWKFQDARSNLLQRRRNALHPTVHALSYEAGAGWQPEGADAGERPQCSGPQ